MDYPAAAPGQIPGSQNPAAVGPAPQMPANSQSTVPASVMQDNPLAPIVALWLEKIKIAADVKEQQFGKDAKECMRFFHGPYDFLYKREYMLSSANFTMSEDSQDIPSPSFQMTCNKASELVQLFGPVLYHTNPTRQCNPREVPLPSMPLLNPQDPMGAMLEQQMQQGATLEQQQDQCRAAIMEWYLNYTPTELGLQAGGRTCVDETLIKGASCLWTELYQPKGTKIRLAGTFWDSVDNLLIDPDMEGLAHAFWIARKCVHPVWWVEREYKLPPGTLKANLESYNQQATTNADIDGDYNRRRGLSNDLLVYWKVWSKMGIGGRLTGCPDQLKATLEQFGDYAYLVIADGTPFPLNCPPAALNAVGADQQQTSEQLLQRFEWPTPYWIDDDWPVELVHFHEAPRQLWPVSHLKPALGELKFLNWCYSFLASKMRVSSRDFLAIKKSAGEDLKERILHGKDYELIELEEINGTISEVVAFLQHPEVNGDMWKVIEMVSDLFEKRTGLTELMYGETARQMRSAEEASLKQQSIQIRPGDMANRLEDHMSGVARREAICARWHLTGADVAPLMGQAGAMYWDQLVRTTDLYALTHQLEYRIESGSMKKPNPERDAANLGQAMQTIFQPLYEHGEKTGNFDPINALITDWAKSIGMEAKAYLLAPPPPPPPPPLPPAEQTTTVEHETATGPDKPARTKTIQTIKGPVPPPAPPAPAPGPGPGGPPPAMAA